MKMTTVFFFALFLSPAYGLHPSESVPAGEKKAIEAIEQILVKGVIAGAKASGHAKRDAHAKAHGCVRGTFHVNDTLPASLRTGAMVEGRNYPAWIRYSNGSGRSQDDTVGDARGMAIKLMDVSGEKLEDEKFTQDFLLINHPVFLVRNALDYVAFSTAVAAGSPTKFFFPSVNPFQWRLHEANIARQITGNKVTQLAETRYWSMTPYLMGSTPAKFSARPCFRGQDSQWKADSPNYLGDNLESYLSERSACFEFLVQLQTDPTSMPVEDPTIEWKESKAPFVKVATLMIESQEFRSEAQQEFCENLSMNPWHAHVQHQPLGGINRVRREVYRKIATLRHDLNREPQTEPTGNEVFH